MNPAAILALISDLYEQMSALRQENDALHQQRAEVQGQLSALREEFETLRDISRKARGGGYEDASEQ